MLLKQRTILITGGTSGIGLELAKQLMARGNTVIVTGRDPQKLKDAAATLQGVYTVQSDASKPEAIEALHARVSREFPACDVLINNAGVRRNLNLNEACPLADVTQEIDIALKGRAARFGRQSSRHLLSLLQSRHLNNPQPRVPACNQSGIARRG